MNRGFTLIELLIVLAIVGIVGSIIIPRFTGGSTQYERPERAGKIVNSVECKNGLLLKNGDPVIENGNAVRC